MNSPSPDTLGGNPYSPNPQLQPSDPGLGIAVCSRPQNGHVSTFGPRINMRFSSFLCIVLQQVGEIPFVWKHPLLSGRWNFERNTWPNCAPLLRGKCFGCLTWIFHEGPTILDALLPFFHHCFSYIVQDLTSCKRVSSIVHSGLFEAMVNLATFYQFRESYFFFELWIYLKPLVFSIRIQERCTVTT